MTRGAKRMSGGKWLLIGALGTGLAGVALVVGAILFGTAASGPTTADALGMGGIADTAPRAAQQAETAAPAVDGLRVDPAWLQETSAATGVGDRALAAYTQAATRVAEEFPECRIGWNTLAGIGYVESYHGTIDGSALDATGTATPLIIGIPLDGTQNTMAIPDTDGGALDGDPVWDRAVGPMQFIPSTWALWGVDGNGDGIADPQNIDDAGLSAARYLCGIGGDLADPERWIAAVAAYNNTVEYNHRVADAATHYASVTG